MPATHYPTPSHHAGRCYPTFAILCRANRAILPPRRRPRQAVTRPVEGLVGHIGQSCSWSGEFEVLFTTPFSGGLEDDAPGDLDGMIGEPVIESAQHGHVHSGRHIRRGAGARRLPGGPSRPSRAHSGGDGAGPSESLRGVAPTGMTTNPVGPKFVQTTAQSEPSTTSSANKITKTTKFVPLLIPPECVAQDPCRPD